MEFLINWHLLRRRDPVVVRHQGFEVCIDAESSDAHVVTEVLVQGMYDEAIRQASMEKTSFSYINLGAHIGAFDIRVAQLVPCLRRGLAVEMNPLNYGRLLLNLGRNRLQAIRTLNAGVWDSVGEMRIEDQERGTSQICSPAPDPEQGRMVPLVTWYEIMKAFETGVTVDLLKIDIEGCEGKFLRHAGDDFLKWVHFLAVETHGEENRTTVISLLEKSGFTKLDDRSTGGETRLLFWRRQKDMIYDRSGKQAVG